MATVSVLLPTYNAAPAVEDAIESILDQTYDDFELLVVDDGSTDDTIDIVRSFDDSRIRLHRRDEDDGLAAALNFGIEKSEGKYVARQDADDVSRPTRLATQVDYLEMSPSVDLVGTGAKIVGPSGGSRGKRNVLQEVEKSNLEEKNHFIHGSIVTRRSALEAVDGYDTNFEYTEDYDLWMRMVEDYELHNINEPLYELHLRNESIYADELETVKLYGRYVVLRDEIEEGTHTEIDLDTVRDRIDPNDFNQEMAMELLRYGNRREARSYLKSADDDPMGIGLRVLSYLPEWVSRISIRAFREILNVKIRRRNSVND